jgi:hypothetical protein
LTTTRQSIIIFDTNSSPYGISFSMWIRRWWKWLISIPSDRNPAIDATGQFCSVSQPCTNVWFLAGTFGDTVSRDCTIPYGKSLLFPVINYETSFAAEPSIKTEKQLEEICLSEIDDIRNIHASIDGETVEVRRYRAQSGCFEVDIPPNNCLGTAQGVTKIASDGYWLFVDSLNVGTHKLKSFGSCKSGRIKIGCTYNLIIK